MSKRCSILLCLLGCVAAGCQQSPYVHAHLELLNAEKRALEDELYELGFDYAEAVREIEQLRAQNSRLRGTGPGSARPTGPAASGPRSTPAPRQSQPELAPPMVDEGMLVDPKIEFPSTPSPAEVPSPRPPGSSGAAAPLPPNLGPVLAGEWTVPSLTESNPRSAPVSAASAARSLEPADPRVTHLALNASLTGGGNFDQQAGDDGIVVVVEPRNRDDQFVPLAGPLTVLLLDPTVAGKDEQSVARWEITANEAQQALRNSAHERGIFLKLPWPGAAPTSGRLQLHVRYLTVDNRDLRTDRPLFLRLPGQVLQQWTPRAAPRSESAAGAAAVPEASSSEPAPLPGLVAEPVESSPLPAEIGDSDPEERSATASERASPRAAASARPAWRPTR